MPFYAKVALIFICLFAFVITMSIGQQIIIPLVYASILGILINPVVNFLIRKRINRIISIFITVTLAVLIVVGFAYAISIQLTMFSEAVPQLRKKFDVTSAEAVGWVSHKLRISQLKINTWIRDTEIDAINNFSIGDKITKVGELVLTLVLLPVYLFMILFYKPLLLEFIMKLFDRKHHLAVTEVLINVKKLIQSYLIGLLFELIIVAGLNSVGLLLIGIDYAIILGIIGAILNVIPYIGGIIAVSLPVAIAFITKDSYSYPLIVILLYLCIQFIDNHFIMPRVVASRVQLNALISVIAVLVGGALWGIPGMFLSIPLTAILKVIFDHIESLKPWGFLLGNTIPTVSEVSMPPKKN
ncbi:MAG TPA: AI-2E family transporter [Cyclobacteriaceae bacterium]|nr:AI-2E family transporter [Cyclobacteriaceae bacterium]